MEEPDIYDEILDIDDRAWKTMLSKMPPIDKKMVIYCTPKGPNLFWEWLQKEAQKTKDRKETV